MIRTSRLRAALLSASAAVVATTTAVPLLAADAVSDAGPAVVAGSQAASDGVAAARKVAPRAAFSTSTRGLRASLDASRSQGRDGRIVSYRWRLGDGTKARGKTLRHSYPRAGVYRVALLVTDDSGRVAKKVKSISISARKGSRSSNVAPRAAFTVSVDGRSARFNASRSKDVDGRIVSYRWRFGGGSTAWGRSTSHRWATSGVRTVHLTVKDDTGAVGTTSRRVSVARSGASTGGQPTTDAVRQAGSKLGMYRGNPGEGPDASYLKAYGEHPSLTASYYTTQAPNEPYELARVKRGTDVFMDFDTKLTPGQIGLIAKRDPRTMTSWVDRNLAAAQRIAQAGKSAGARVYVAFTHEWEVKRAQNVLKNASDRDPGTYAAAYNVFAKRARAIAPDVELVYWVGGFPTNTGIIDQVMAGFDFRPDVIAWDPYVTANGKASTTATQLFRTFAQHLESNPTYRGWGRPTKALGEFGFSLKHGDAAAAAFYRGVEEGMRANGISLAIQFNRDKQDPTSYVHYKIDGGSSPQAARAFAAAAASVNGS